MTLPTDCTICHGPCRATKAKAIMDALPIETQRLLWAGKLDQTCPACHHEEPAGYRCDKCGAAIHPVAWHRRKQSDKQTAASKRAAANLHRRTRRAPDSGVAA